MNEQPNPKLYQTLDLEHLQAVKTQLEIDQLRAPWFRRHSNQTAMLTIFSAVIVGTLGLVGVLGGTYFNSERLKLATEVAKSDNFTTTIKSISDAGGVAMVGTTDNALSYMVIFDNSVSELFRDLDSAMWSDEPVLKPKQRLKIDDVLRSLHYLPNVTVLAISSDEWEVTQSGISGLSQLKNLQALLLYGQDIDDEVIRSVSRFKSLKLLDLSSNKVTNEGLSYIGNLRELEHLAISGVNITDAGLSNLRGLSRLTTIELSGFGLSNEAIKEISDLKSLENVYIAFAIGDAELAQIARLPALTTLSIADASGITDEGLASLGRMPSLTRLELMQAKQVSDRAIGYITDRRQLRSLVVTGSSFTDVAICRIPMLPNLLSLQLDGKNITNHGLIQLSSMKQLERLQLDVKQAYPDECGGRNCAGRRAQQWAVAA